MLAVGDDDLGICDGILVQRSLDDTTARSLWMTGRRTDDAQLTASGRLEASSDGVFAIAITLLVLDIGVPARGDLPAGGLGAALAHPWPSYVAYLVSFLVIGIIWVNHHTMFSKVDRIDRPVLSAHRARAAPVRDRQHRLPGHHRALVRQCDRRPLGARRASAVLLLRPAHPVRAVSRIGKDLRASPPPRQRRRLGSR
ncbi:MAG: DUF1211 domain-containing protein [Nocardioides sp.]|nr:DUF1211 domain-containing protein [Nocardioides sp.]